MNLRSIVFVCLVLVSGCTAHYRVSPTDVKYVWWAGGEKHIRELADADPQSFAELNSAYGKDKERVYWMGQEIADATPDGFKPLSLYYAIDTRHAFFTTWTLTGSEAQSFELLEGNWSKDRANYYYNRWNVPVCDYDSFRLIADEFPSRGLDDQCYISAGEFRGPQIVDVLDFGSLEILPADYAKDSQAAYWGNTRIPDADPGSFEVRYHWTLSIARDNQRCYSGPRVLACNQVGGSNQDWCRCVLE